MDKPIKENRLREIELEKKNSRNKIIIGILIGVLAVLIILIAVGAALNGGMFQQEAPFELQNVNFKNWIDSNYIQLTGSIKPKKDLSYLEARVTFYDANHNVIRTENLAWNEINLQKDKIYSFDSKSVPLSIPDNLAYAVVEFYETGGHEPLGSANVTFTGSNNTTDDSSDSSSSSDSGSSSSQRQAYAYKSDGTPMYSQSEVDNYMYNKYGDVNYHLQDNGYVNLDEPGVDDAGNPE